MSDDIGQYDDDFLNSLTPEQREAILASGEIGAEGDILQEQLAQAKAMRGQKLGEGRQAGRVFVASSPLEALATGIANVKGQQGIEAAQAGQKALVGKETAGKRAMLSGELGAAAIRKKLQKMKAQTGSEPIQAPTMVPDDWQGDPTVPTLMESQGY